MSCGCLTSPRIRLVFGSAFSLLFMAAGLWLMASACLSFVSPDTDNYLSQKPNTSYFAPVTMACGSFMFFGGIGLCYMECFREKNKKVPEENDKCEDVPDGEMYYISNAQTYAVQRRLQELGPRNDIYIVPMATTEDVGGKSVNTINASE